MSVDEALTVSSVGTAAGYPPNNGADFGPDTINAAGTGYTSTTGVQEALTAAKTLGISRVVLLPGTFTLETKVSWPQGWSGILEGSGFNDASSTTSQGSVLLADSSLSDTAMLTLGGVYPSGG